MRKLSLLLSIPLLILVGTSCNIFDNDSTSYYKLSTSVSPANGGSLNPVEGEFEEETQIEITAEPAEGFLFDHWEGDHNGDKNPTTLTFTSDKNLTAVFVRKEYTMEVNVEGEGSVDEEIVEHPSKADYEHGTTVQITAVPDDGWHFVEWQGDITGTTNPETIEVEDEKSVTAVFERTEYSLAVNIEGEGDVFADPDNSIYYFGDEITLTARPDQHWRFIEWQGDAEGTDTTFTIEDINDDQEVTAVFIPVEDPLWAMGYNHNGQLGDGSQTEQHFPVRNIYNVDKVTGGAYHSLFIKTDGTLWAMGFNNHGQVGNGTTQDATSPIQIESGVTKVTAGEHHSLFIKEDGTLWAMGENTDGQLGDGTTEDRLTPVQIDSDVADVAAGAWHTLYIKNDGSLWGMGRSNYGQLGIDSTSSQKTPMQITTDVSLVAGGKYHSLFVKNDGTMFGMGRNASGQLGIGRESEGSAPPDELLPVQIDTDVIAIKGGTDHSLYIKTDGTLWAMGNNEYGQLGDDTTSNRHDPVQISSDAADIAAGNRHSLFVSSNGTLFSMGNNGNGQLGDGTTTNRQTPVEVDTDVIGVAAGINHSLYIVD